MPPLYFTDLTAPSLYKHITINLSLIDPFVLAGSCSFEWMKVELNLVYTGVGLSTEAFHRHTIYVATLNKSYVLDQLQTSNDNIRYHAQ